MFTFTLNTAILMATMVVARPTIQDHSTEGYDVLLTQEQLSKMHPGSLEGIAGKCSALRGGRYAITNSNVDTREACLDWCVNENVEEQTDIGACEYAENGAKKPTCTAFLASAFKDQTVTADGNAEYKCYSLFSDGEHRSARSIQLSNFWENNELIYDIVDASDSESWESNGYSQASAVAYIHLAITEYHTKTNIRFVQRTTEANYVSIGYFGGGCSSNVGKINMGAQRVTLGWCRDSLGSIIHEFGHALGLFHEHTRADRDNYLNVPSGANGNFDVANTDPRGIDYDFGSVMHYPLTTEWSDGTGTIVMTLTTEGTTLRSEQGNPTIGQRTGLSQLDIAGLAKVYPHLGGSHSPTTSAPTPSPTPSSAPTPAAFIFQGSISVGDTQTGNTNFPGESTRGNGAFDHVYSVTITSIKTYHFSTCGDSGFDTLLRIYNDNNTAIAVNDDSCGLRSTISITLYPGEYMLLVEGYGAAAGEYALTMTSEIASTTTAPTPAPTTSPTTTSCPEAALDQYVHSPSARDFDMDHKLKSFEDSSAAECAKNCRETEACFAFNFGNSQKKCVLMMVPDQSNSSYHESVSSNNWDYYRMSPNCVFEKLCPRSLDRFEKSPSSRDKDTSHVLLTKKDTLEWCTLRCINTAECVAFNYKSNNGKCFLLSKGSTEDQTFHTQAMDVWSYYRMSTECRV